MKYFREEKTNNLYYVEGNAELQDNFVEISEEDYKKILSEQQEALKIANEKARAGFERLAELQNKAILEGLTDSKKEEYKKLKGGE